MNEVSARSFLEISEANPKDVAELSEKNFLEKIEQDKLGGFKNGKNYWY